MDITITDLQKKIPLNSPQILKITKAILRQQNINQAVLSIVFVSSQKIKALNKKYLNRSYVTDVLAFDLRDDDFSSKKIDGIMGDIIISTDAAIKNAGAFESSLAQEVTLYLIHGILHLLGYDDHSPKDVKKMRKKEEEILNCLGTKTNKILL